MKTLVIILFNIQPASLADCVEQWGRMTGLQAIYRSEHVRNKECSAVTGYMDHNDALRLILMPNGLEWRYVNERTITIGPIS